MERRQEEGTATQPTAEHTTEWLAWEDGWSGPATAPGYWVGDREDFRVCQANVGMGQWKKLDDLIDLVGRSKIEGTIRPDLDQAWQQMILKATTADSADETRKIVAAWPETPKKLGQEDMLVEKNAMVKAFR